MSHPTPLQSIVPFLLGTALLISTSGLYAEESTSRSTRSISYAEQQKPEQAQRDSELQASTTEIFEPLDTEGFRYESAPKAVLVSLAHSVDITLFDASTELVSDLDHDGFYHRFSVTIDADTIYPTSYVYAELYLSYEGGPWNHIATSDSYHIHGDSALDTFTVETELAEGFPAGYYDVRIELYDADHGDWLDTLGPYDDSSLSALPLEDDYRDDAHYDHDHGSLSVGVSATVGAGATGWGLMLLPLVIAGMRRVNGGR